MAITFVQNMPLDCYDDASSNQRFVTFNLCGRASVVQGSNTLDKVDLSKISIPISEFTHTSTVLENGDTLLNGVANMKFMMILVTYPTDESITSANRYIEWSMDNTNWNVLREMMVLTGEDNLVYIRNTRGFSVRLEILATK
jgi:hypothetical protein